MPNSNYYSLTVKKMKERRSKELTNKACQWV